jgi:hypothetical protein
VDRFMNMYNNINVNKKPSRGYSDQIKNFDVIGKKRQERIKSLDMAVQEKIQRLGRPRFMKKKFKFLKNRFDLPLKYQSKNQHTLSNSVLKNFHKNTHIY